jgi:hypothetical protein
MSGYAVMKNGSSWRMVDGPEADPNDESKLFPDPNTETYSKTQPSSENALLPADAIIVANMQRDSLLTTAALRIAPLQDAIDLDSATDADKANLKLWKQYRVDVNRVSSQTGFPATIDWPQVPA